MNGRVVRELGTKADPLRDHITVDGKPIPSLGEFVYVALHKPVHVVTTLSDPQGRPTVRELLPKLRVRVFPVGRLDYHSSGLLLLTNDGELALRLMHPRYGVEKVYHVKVRGTPGPETLAQLRTGIRLSEGIARVQAVRVLHSSGSKSWLEVRLAEGRKREIRRLCQAVGHEVEKLRRVAIGPLRLGSLQPGKSRILQSKEIAALRRAVGLPV